jgi:hypothetical protein
MLGAESPGSEACAAWPRGPTAASRSNPASRWDMSGTARFPKRCEWPSGERSASASSGRRMRRSASLMRPATQTLNLDPAEGLVTPAPLCHACPVALCATYTWPQLRTRPQRNFTGENFRARGYFVSTVGLDENRVRAYMRNQEQEAERYDQMKLGVWSAALGGYRCCSAFEAVT